MNVYVGATPVTVVCQLLPLATACVRTVTDGETAETPGICAIARPSWTVSVEAVPKPPRAPLVVALPGCTIIKLEPRLLMLDCTDVRAPTPMATVTMTAATPITMPSIVSIERALLRINACIARRIVALRFMPHVSDWPGRSRYGRRGT